MEGFGVPRKRHLPPLNVTNYFALFLAPFKGIEASTNAFREALRKHVAHYGGVWCPKERPFATFDRDYSLFLAAFRTSGPRQMRAGSLKETCGALRKDLVSQGNAICHL